MDHSTTIRQAAGIEDLMKRKDLSFRDAYAALVRSGTIIHMDPSDDEL